MAREGEQTENGACGERGRSPRLIDAKGVARLLGCSWRTVLRLADGGQIPWGVKLGGLRRWDVREIEAFITGGCKMPAGGRTRPHGRSRLAGCS
jgi:predicted DNA-binding transcriptional regulator AlpA